MGLFVILRFMKEASSDFSSRVSDCRSLGEAMRQIGNAVPVLLAQKIGQQLYNLLNEEVEPLLCSNFN